MAKNAFQRFIEREESGSKKKERIRQDKKKIRQETKEYFARKKETQRGRPTPLSETEKRISSSKPRIAPSDAIQNERKKE
ncbi:MAG TPA: hypothetical protein VM012_10465, partial [Flavitalea sp.]|nr:hypothetical protein [Flavitalea sp.]